MALRNREATGNQIQAAWLCSAAASPLGCWVGTIWTAWAQLIPSRIHIGTFLVAQWLSIHLLMQETWVWSLVQEDLTCHRAAKPVCCNCWACGLEPGNLSYWAGMPWSLSPTTREIPAMRSSPTAMKSSPSSPQLKKSPCSSEDPAEIQISNFLKITHNGPPNLWYFCYSTPKGLRQQHRKGRNNIR